MVVRIVVFLLLAGGALAAVIPTVGSTVDAVVVSVIAVAIIGFVIFIWSQGGTGFQGGWRNRGPMG